MSTRVHTGEKRWLKLQKIDSAFVEEACEGLFIVRLQSADSDYILPAMKCSCPEKYSVAVDGNRLCEAEFCPEFLEKISSCGGLDVEEFCALGEAHYERAIAEDATNPHVLLSSPQGLFVLKGYRLVLSPNFEPLFLKALEGSGIAPELALAYYFKGISLGIVTNYIPGARDPGSLFYSSLLQTLRGDWQIPSSEAAGVGRAVARFHGAMLACREEWCAPRDASSRDVESWSERLLFYAGSLEERGLLPPEAARLAREAGNLFGEFAGHTILRTHQDLHFSQMVKSGDKYYILDFEGEPGRPKKYRLDLEPPVRDLASLLRGLSYIVFFALAESSHLDIKGTLSLLESGGQSVRVAGEWALEVAERIVAEYLRSADKTLVGASSVEDLFRVIKPWFVERALYEAYYEAGYRPDNVYAALATLLRPVPPLL